MSQELDFAYSFNVPPPPTDAPPIETVLIRSSFDVRCIRLIFDYHATECLVDVTLKSPLRTLHARINTPLHSPVPAIREVVQRLANEARTHSHFPQP